MNETMMTLKELILNANTGADAIRRAPIVSEDTGVKCLRIGDVSQKKPFSEWGFTKTSAEDYQRFKLLPDDIVVARTGNTIGVNCFIEESINSVFNNGLIRIKADTSKVIPRYLWYLISSKSCQDYIMSIAFGTSTQPNMKIKDFLNYSFLYQDISVQRKIVDIISSIDNRINCNNAINQNLSQQIQTIYNNLIEEVDGEPVEMSSVIEVRDGTHDSPRPQEAGFPLVTSKHLLPYGVDLSSPNKISKDDYDKINERSRVETYDILLSMIGTVGLISLVIDNPVEFAIKNVGLFKTSANEDLFPFVLAYLRSNSTMQYIDKVLAGSTQKYISLGELRKMPIVMPSAQQISDFNAVVKPIIWQIINLTNECKRLIELRDTLLPRLMSGELDVSEIEL